MRAYQNAMTWRLKGLHVLGDAQAQGRGASLIGQYENALDQELGAMRVFMKAAPRAMDQALFKMAVLLLDHEHGPPWYLGKPGERFCAIRDQLSNTTRFL